MKCLGKELCIFTPQRNNPLFALSVLNIKEIIKLQPLTRCYFLVVYFLAKVMKYLRNNSLRHLKTKSAPCMFGVISKRVKHTISLHTIQCVPYTILAAVTANKQEWLVTGVTSEPNSISCHFYGAGCIKKVHGRIVLCE